MQLKLSTTKRFPAALSMVGLGKLGRCGAKMSQVAKFDYS